MSAEALAATLAVIGIVIIVASLLSGIVEKWGIPQVAIFLGLGAVLGPAGFGLVDLTLESPALRMIASIGLVLVLFTDAIAVDFKEVRRHRKLALLILFPGTLIPSLVLAGAGWLMLGLHPVAAAILGAALASTDPVMLRALIRHPELPRDARLALKLESGMNDAVLLPVVVLSMLVLQPGGVEAGGMARHAVGLFLLGPALGAAVGWVAIVLLDRIRGRFGVRRDYESLYALGVAFTAYAAAEAVGGSGFLSAFAAGLVVAALDVELCDCFLDYGEATAEMFLLLTFLAFGGSMIWSGLVTIDLPTVGYALIAMAVRTMVLLVLLRPAGVETRSRRIISLMGPRGLSSLLLVLLPVFAGIAGAERLFAITTLVVLMSVVVHGAGIAWFVRRVAANSTVATGKALPVPLASADASPSTGEVDAAPELITIEEVETALARGDSLVLVDARTERSRGQDNLEARDSVRLEPGSAVRDATALALEHHGTLVVYCA